MKQVPAYQLLYGASFLMMLGFCVHLGVDRMKYNASVNAAPFWIWICADVLIWLVPAVLAFLAGWIVKRKFRNKEKKHDACN